MVGKEADKVDVASGDGPLSVRVRPSGLQRDCDRRATSAAEGFRRTYTRSHAGPRRPLRTLRPETKGQAGACPGWTRAIPCIAGGGHTRRAGAGRAGALGAVRLACRVPCSHDGEPFSGRM